MVNFAQNHMIALEVTGTQGHKLIITYILNVWLSIFLNPAASIAISRVVWSVMLSRAHVNGKPVFPWPCVCETGAAGTSSRDSGYHLLPVRKPGPGEGQGVVLGQELLSSSSGTGASPCGSESGLRFHVRLTAL